MSRPGPGNLRPSYAGPAPASATTARDYRCEVEVYLEGKTDQLLFQERWFVSPIVSAQKRTLVFVPAGSCTSVIKRVREVRANGGVAFGVVDRDALFREKRWAEFLEADDAQFRTRPHYGTYIRVLSRWEVESYAFGELATLANEHANALLRAPDLTATARELFAIAETLLVVTHLLIRAHSPLSACSPPLCVDRNGIAGWAAMVAAAQVEVPGFDPVREPDHPKIMAFDDRTLPDSQRWESVIRILDGKRLLTQLCSLLMCPIGGAPRDRMLFRLALASSPPPKELQEIIDEFMAAA